MNYFKGQERICQRDAPGDPSTRCSVEIPDIFSDVQPSRDRPRPHITCEDGLIRPRLDGSLRNDEFATHRFCCPLVADTSPSYSSVPCPDRMPPQSSPSHFWNPLLGLGKNEPCVWTAEGAVPYGMLSEEISDAVASISTEVADECSQQAYSRQEFDGDLAQYNQLDLGQNEQPRQKIPVYASNVCQVVCSVNGEGQMLMLNHCSPKQLVHPEALGCGAPSLQPSWCPADPKGSPQHCLTQGRGDGVPVSLCPVQTGLSSQPYPSSLTCSAIVQPSSVLSPASGYMFNLMPAPYTSQFHQAPCPEHPDTVGRTLEGQTSRSSHVSWERLKKPCNCTKSQCLKLYCDCFANGEVCSNCNCINCCNNMEHESERCRAIKICLDRNPEAFHPKIDIRKRGCLKGRHTKGCNCKRSGCLKNYCECYEAKIMCSSSCKCVGCRNYEGSPVMERAGRDNPSSTYNLYSDSCNTKSPLSCITPDVVEATCGCLLAQAEEAEKDGQASPQAERLILEEFGQCLAQIVQSIFKYTRVKW